MTKGVENTVSSTGRLLREGILCVLAAERRRVITWREGGVGPRYGDHRFPTQTRIKSSRCTPSTDPMPYVNHTSMKRVAKLKRCVLFDSIYMKCPPKGQPEERESSLVFA